MSLTGGISYSQARTVRPVFSGGETVCKIVMTYTWPNVDPTNVIHLNVGVDTVNSRSILPYRVSQDLPSITVPDDQSVTTINYEIVL
jgi:hypothetical protein